jgi:hypothetical protein
MSDSVFVHRVLKNSWVLPLGLRRLRLLSISCCFGMQLKVTGLVQLGTAPCFRRCPESVLASVRL